jgi:hypothetical protein
MAAATTRTTPPILNANAAIQAEAVVATIHHHARFAKCASRRVIPQIGVGTVSKRTSSLKIGTLEQQ